MSVRMSLPPGYRVCVCHHAVPPGPCRHCGRLQHQQRPAQPTAETAQPSRSLTQAAKPSPGISKAAEPNKTELEYRRLYLDPRLASGDLIRIRFLAIRLFLDSGHSYRPDWVCTRADGTLECHEVKGAYIFSRDSRILFDEARVEYPEIRFLWAQRKRDGWRVQQHD